MCKLYKFKYLVVILFLVFQNNFYAITVKDLLYSASVSRNFSREDMLNLMLDHKDVLTSVFDRISTSRQLTQNDKNFLTQLKTSITNLNEGSPAGEFTKIEAAMNGRFQEIASKAGVRVNIEQLYNQNKYNITDNYAAPTPTITADDLLAKFPNQYNESNGIIYHTATGSVVGRVGSSEPAVLPLDTVPEASSLPIPESYGDVYISE